MLNIRLPHRWWCVVWCLQVMWSPLVWAQTPPLLNAAMAVDLALKNHRQIQAGMLEVGISQAELLQAGQWPNPGFSFGLLKQGDEQSLSQGIHFNWGKLLFKKELEQSAALRVQLRQQELALEIMQLTHETQKAFIEAVAASSNRRYMHKVLSAAEAGAVLAQRMKAAGNFTKLQETREQMFRAEAVQAVNKAKRQEKAALEKLQRLMSLPADQFNFILPEQLPELPDQLETRDNLEALALTQRLDLQLAKRRTEELAMGLGLTKATRYVNVLELGVTRQTSNLSATEHGLQMGFELPIFDNGQTRLSIAQQRYEQSLLQTAHLALIAQSQVREAHANYLLAHELAIHHRDVVLPLQQSMAEENMLRYNGMLIGVFELLADTRNQIHSTVNYMDSVKDYWLAHIDLDLAMNGQPLLPQPSDAAITRSTSTATSTAH